MDALGLLRDYCVRGALGDVRAVGGEVHFGDAYSFPAATPTRFRSDSGEHYTLGAVLFFAQEGKGRNPGEYVRSAIAARRHPVTITDRKALADYLDGALDASAVRQIVTELPAPPAAPPQMRTPTAAPSGSARAPPTAARCGCWRGTSARCATATAPCAPAAATWRRGSSRSRAKRRSRGRRRRAQRPRARRRRPRCGRLAAARPQPPH